MHRAAGSPSAYMCVTDSQEAFVFILRRCGMKQVALKCAGSVSHVSAGGYRQRYGMQVHQAQGDRRVGHSS